MKHDDKKAKKEEKEEEKKKKEEEKKKKEEEKKKKQEKKEDDKKKKEDDKKKKEDDKKKTKVRSVTKPDVLLTCAQQPQGCTADQQATNQQQEWWYQTPHLHIDVLACSECHQTLSH